MVLANPTYIRYGYGTVRSKTVLYSQRKNEVRICRTDTVHRILPVCMVYPYHTVTVQCRTVSREKGGPRFNWRYASHSICILPVSREKGGPGFNWRYASHSICILPVSREKGGPGFNWRYASHSICILEKRAKIILCCKKKGKI